MDAKTRVGDMGVEVPLPLLLPPLHPVTKKAAESARIAGRLNKAAAVLLKARWKRDMKLPQLGSSLLNDNPNGRCPIIGSAHET